MKKLLLLFWMLALLLGISCNVQKREIEKLHSLNYKYPNEMAADCAKWFPVKDSISKAVKPADNIDYTINIDSLSNALDSLSGYSLIGDSGVTYTTLINSIQKQAATLKQNYKPCKSDTIIHFITDMAQLANWQNKYKVKADSLVITKTEFADKSKAKDIWMWVALGCSALILIFLGVKTYLFFSGGAILSTVKKLI